MFGRVLKSGGNLACNGPGETLFERTFAFDTILQRFSVEQLHGQINAPFMDAVVIGSYDVRMAEPGNHLGFHLTSRCNAGMTKAAQVDRLQSNRAIESFLSG